MLDTAFSLGEITPLEQGYYAPEQLHMLDAEAFCQLVKVFGAGRIVFGTDCPWADQQSSLEQLRQLPLAEGDRQAILGGNAARLLGL